MSSAGDNISFPIMKETVAYLNLNSYSQQTMQWETSKHQLKYSYKNNPKWKF